MFAAFRILLVVAILAVSANELCAQARVQITIGNYGRGIGGPFGPPIGVGPVGPGLYGVPPSLPFAARGRGIVPVPIPVPYYSGYRGYNFIIPSPPSIGVYGYNPYATAVPNDSSYYSNSMQSSYGISGSDYPYSGTGPYSGPSSSTNSGIAGSYGQSYRAPAQTGYPSGVQSGTPDLRPGMVLPDGSTVLSVDPPSSNSPTIAPRNNTLPVPAPSKPGRTAF